jgi:hypothetical protein
MSNNPTTVDRKLTIQFPLRQAKKDLDGKPTGLLHGDDYFGAHATGIYFVI